MFELVAGSLLAIQLIAFGNLSPGTRPVTAIAAVVITAVEFVLGRYVLGIEVGVMPEWATGL